MSQLYIDYTSVAANGRRKPAGGAILPVTASATGAGTQPITPTPDGALVISLRSDTWAKVDVATSPDPTGTTPSVRTVGPGAPIEIPNAAGGLRISTIGTGAPGGASGADLTLVQNNVANLNSKINNSAIPSVDQNGYVNLQGGPRIGQWLNGKYTATPDTLQILGPGATIAATLYRDPNAELIVFGSYSGGVIANSMTMDRDGTYFNKSVTGYYGGTFLRTDGTYGGGLSAAGVTFSINGFRTQVPNVALEPQVLSSYASRDHIGVGLFMQAPPFISVPASGTTYTATTITNPALVSGGALKIGVVIDTAHSPKWSGVVTAINDAAHTVTVSAWYRVDGSGTTGAPSNGVGAVINPCTKTWVSNDVHDIGTSPYDLDAISHELDQRIDRAGLGEVYGWDAVAYGQYQPNNLYAFTARHGGQVARYHAGSTLWTRRAPRSSASRRPPQATGPGSCAPKSGWMSCSRSMPRASGPLSVSLLSRPR